MTSAIGYANFHLPQPGEIWQLDSLSRYVMIVSTRGQITDRLEWPTVLVMVLSLETEFISDVDLVIPSHVAQLPHHLLAETWHLQQMLVKNLSRKVGCRLSRSMYDVLMTVGDGDHCRADDLPQLLELQSCDLQIGDRCAQTDLAIQTFHRRESAWSDVLTVPLAAYQSYLKGMQATEHLLRDAISRLSEFTFSST